MMPLYILAENKKLPQYQHMDSGTLAWIKDNKPSNISNNFAGFSKQEQENLIEAIEVSLQSINRYIPINKKCFLNKIERTTIHGELHAYRVSLLSGIVSFYMQYNNTEASIIAGLFHDIARKNDKEDVLHGLRSAKWLEANINILNQSFNLNLIEDIVEAIANHESPELFESHTLTTILKTADALDRYRLPKRKWWPDVSRMVYKPSDILMSFSFEFIIRSEAKIIDSKTPYDAFVDTLSEIVMIINHE